MTLDEQREERLAVLEKRCRARIGRAEGAEQMRLGQRWTRVFSALVDLAIANDEARRPRR
ncbi:hypothetical protein [Leucobacter sp. GX0328]